MRVAQNGHGGFGGDAVDVADDVAVEHEVADDEDADIVEAAFEEAEDAVEFGKHSRVRIARAAGPDVREELYRRAHFANSTQCSVGREVPAVFCRDA